MRNKNILIIIFIMIISFFVMGIGAFSTIPLNTSSDELGAIVGAANMAGYDWTGVLGGVNYYGFGWYGLFFWDCSI